MSRGWWRHHHTTRRATRQASQAGISALLGMLLILTSCATSESGQRLHAHKKGASAAAAPAPALTPDPYAYAWHNALPNNRLLLYYYIPGAPWGFLGAYNDNDLLARIQAQSQQYDQLDPAHPVISGLDIAAPVVQADPGPDGYYAAFPSSALLHHYLDLATRQHMLFFLDMQIGRAPLMEELAAIWPYLELPNVGLALDPEFDVAPDGIPDVTLGHMRAAEINTAIDALAALVADAQLPPKVLVIHQWAESMLPDWYNIKIKPGVKVITCSDGFGPPAAKEDDYQQFDNVQKIQYPGIKLFYPNFPGAEPHPTLDEPLISPADVL